MLRKTILAIAASAALSAAALAPTSASAYWGGGWHGGYGGWAYHPFVRVYAGPVLAMVTAAAWCAAGSIRLTEPCCAGSTSASDPKSVTANNHPGRSRPG